MRIIVGIGNPGKRYENNRHNVGFMLLDYIANINSLTFIPSKSDYLYAQGKVDNSPFLLAKPTTYVNASGLAVNQLVEQYNTEMQDILVIYDDVNLITGKIRIRLSGGDGGHNGIYSIIYHLNSNQFPRIRMGIGSAFSKGEMADYVLSDFTKDELEILKKSFLFSETLVEEFIKGGIKQMLDVNSKLSSKESEADAGEDKEAD